MGAAGGFVISWVEGSVAAQFLMGAGNHLQWEEHPQLRSAMNAVIAGIESCAQENGFILGFTENKLATNEHPNYVLSWTIHGLLAASGAGNELALPMARKMMSLFNNHTLLPPPPPWQELQRKIVLTFAARKRSSWLSQWPSFHGLHCKVV